MAKDAVERLERTVLFQTLYKREKESGEGHEISERVKAVVAHVAPLLERVPEQMPEFTLHDPNHGAKVVELMAQILPADTRERLNVVELSTLIYSAYLHDLGMTCSADEREQLIKGDAEFARLLAADESRSLLLQQFRDEGEHRAATAVEDQVFTEYLRRTHVRRSARFIDEHLADGELMIGWQGVSYARWVRAVCDSHALPVSRLRDEVTWPRNALVRTLRVNVQYLALILRLADILDLDPERTPKVLLDFINPKDPRSVIEWHKHRSVIGWEITPERIRVEAVCRHPVYERALREFLGWIEEERRDSMLLASRYKDDIAELYHLDLRDPVVQERVTSDGAYIYSDLKFNIDYRRVLNLLMGERLYGNPVVALRELLQNSVDAVRHREALAARADEPFEPSIAVRLTGDKLIIEDNGVGMDEHIVKNYFMQVGRSYYRSPEFRAAQLDIDPVSEFGIGILSVFMVADRCEIESRRYPDNPLHPEPPIKIEIPTAYDYFVQRPTDRKTIGTTITLFLKPDHPFKEDKLLKTISDIAPFIEYSVLIQNSKSEHEYRPRTPGEEVVDGRYTFLEVPFDGSDDTRLTGVQGSMYINASDSETGVIAQRGFAIQPSTDIFDSRSGLLPIWVGGVKASIDLRKGASLTLTPSRGEIVKDARFATLKAAIEDRALEVFRDHLQSQKSHMPVESYSNYIDQLIETRALFLVKDETRERLSDLFLNYVPFPCLAENDPSSRKLGRELVEAEVVGLTSPDKWPDFTDGHEVLAAFRRATASSSLLVCLPQKGPVKERTYWYSAVYGLLGDPTGLLISSIPGVVFDLISTSARAQEEWRELHKRVGWRSVHLSNQIISRQGDTAPVLAHGSSSLDAYLFNARHPLIAPIPYVFLNSLSGRISEILQELAKGTALIKKTRDNQFIDRYRHPNFVLVGVLKREPAFLDSLREAFAKTWREAHAGDATSQFPGLTAEDLPWFWSYEE